MKFSNFQNGILWNFFSFFFLATGGITVNLIILAFKDNSALGVFNQTYAIYIILSQFSVCGIHLYVLKQISHNQRNSLLCGQVTTSALTLVTLISILFCALGSFFEASIARFLDSPIVGQSLRYAIIGLPFFSMNKVLLNVINGLNQIPAFASFRSARCVLIPTILFFLLPLDSAYLSLCLPLTEAVLFIGLISFVSRSVSLRFNFEKAQFIEQLFYGIRSAPSGLLLELNSRIDLLVLGHYYDDDTVGTYSFAAMVAEGFAQLPLSFRGSVDPLLGKYFARDRILRIGGILKKIKARTYTCTILVNSLAVLFYPIICSLFITAHDLQTSWLTFTIIMLGATVGSGFRPLSGLLLQGDKPGRYSVLVLVLALINTILSFLLVPSLGAIGAAMSAGTTYAIEAVLLLYICRYLWEIRL